MNNNYLYFVGLDILEHITSFINDPHDLDNLSKTYPWLFKNIIPNNVKDIWVNPLDMIYFDLDVLIKYSNVKSARIDIKVTDMEDLILLLQLPKTAHQFKKPNSGKIH